MSALAVMLIAVGIADACRRAWRTRWVPAAAGPVSIVVLAVLSALWRPGDLVLLTIAAGATVAWELLCERTERTGRHAVRPLVVLAAAIGLLIILSGLGSRVGGAVAHWSAWSTLSLDADPTWLLMVCAAVLLQLVTGNQIVRLILAATGSLRPPGQPQPSDRLKGGRLLGPMERVLILGLGLAGQLAASTAVIAAKSIIRFPELSSTRKDAGDQPGIDEVTEYFLVGSFASWLLAMAGLALTRTVPP